MKIEINRKISALKKENSDSNMREKLLKRIEDTVSKEFKQKIKRSHWMIDLITVLIDKMEDKGENHS